MKHRTFGQLFVFQKKDVSVADIVSSSKLAFETLFLHILSFTNE